MTDPIAAAALRRLLPALIALAGLLAHGALQAMTNDERQQIFSEAQRTAIEGPKDVPLAGQAVLHLPVARGFVPVPLAHKVLEAMGNPGQDPRLQGLIFPSGGDSWFMTVRYEAAGYVKDDEARDWNADELLASYREGTEQANTERAKLGEPGLEIIGWAAEPAYDASTHRLAWAMTSRLKGAPADEVQGVNYNTYALGREGYFSLNLVTNLDQLTRHQPAAHGLLAALQYDDGKRYEDFNASTDHVAEYGIAALVAGVAAKKLGLLAVALAFVAKFAKVIFIAVAGGGAVLAKFWRRKPAAGSSSTAAGTATSSPAASTSAAAAAPPPAPPAPPAA